MLDPVASRPSPCPSPPRSRRCPTRCSRCRSGTSALLRRFRWGVLVVGVGASALVAVTLVPVVLHQDSRPRLVGLDAASRRRGVRARCRCRPTPTGRRSRPTSAGAHSCTADDVEACTVVHGDGPHVLVVGDSHAQMLAPMFTDLAERHDLTLSLNINAGCSWQENLDQRQAEPRLAARLRGAPVGWYDDVLPSSTPTWCAGQPRARRPRGLVGPGRSGAAAASSPTTQMMYGATTETIDKYPSLVPRTLVVQSMVMPNTFEPDDCLTSTPRRLEVRRPGADRGPRQRRLLPGRRRRVAQGVDGEPHPGVLPRRPRLRARSSTATSSGATTTTSPRPSPGTARRRSGT